VPLQELGVSVSGIEISPHAAEIARREHDLDVHTGTIFDAPYASNSFDVVVMRHVIEHFPSARLALKKVAHLLKPGGVLFITTPNFDSLDGKIFGRYWHDLDPPRHLAVFSVTTLDRMLKNTGLETLNIKHSLVPNSWIYSIRNVLIERFGDGFLLQAFSIRNPFMWLFFFPFGMIQKGLRKSGRIDVVARKKT
jgi:SAM-dependent methyltransferase